MSFRLLKTKKIAPGLTLRATKTGLGFSVGGMGLRMSAHSSGRVTGSAGLPGTGLFVTKSQKVTRKPPARERSPRTIGAAVTPGGDLTERPARPERRASPRTTGAAATPHEDHAERPATGRSLIPTPPAGAPRYEFDYRAAAEAHLAGDTIGAFVGFEWVVRQQPRSFSARLFAAIYAPDAASPYAAVTTLGPVELLEPIAFGAVDLPDRLQARYLPTPPFELRVRVSITPAVTIICPWDWAGAMLLLIEHYQRAERCEDAMSLARFVVSTAPANLWYRLSLAELLLVAGSYREVLDLVGTPSPRDDVTAELARIRAFALIELGDLAAGAEAFAQLAETSTQLSQIVARAVRADADLLGVRLVAADPTLGPTIDGAPRPDSANLRDPVIRNVTGKKLERDGMADEAMRLYEETVRLYPNNLFPYDRLAILHRRRRSSADEVRILRAKLDAMDANPPSTREYLAAERVKTLERLVKAQDRLVRALK